MGRREDNREERLTEAKRAQAMISEGKSKVEVSKALKIPRRSLYRYLDELEEEGLESD